MTEISEKFERQIQRIHQLLEQPESTITWNDHLPDPDNTTQARQIDITIRRDNLFTIVECRIHKKKQNVKWIEELIGRRTSLKADTIIAVSASGFTNGAVSKAKAYGIILRDMFSLSGEEIKQWGKKTTIKLIFYQFTNIKMGFVFDAKCSNTITHDNIFKYMLTHNDKIFGIFEAAAKFDDNHNPRLRPMKFSISLTSKKLLIGDKPVKEIHFSANFKLHEQQLDSAGVFVYGEPDIEALKRNVFVENVELGNFEVDRTVDKATLVWDLTAITSPPNCLFRIIDYDFGETITICGVTMLGPFRNTINIKDIDIGFCFKA